MLIPCHPVLSCGADRIEQFRICRIWRDRVIFPAMDRWGTLEERVLSRQSGNLIVKRHCVAAELNPRDVSAHELRSGYLTEGLARA